MWLGPFVEPMVNFRNIRYLESNGFVIPPKNIAAFDLLDQDISSFATKPENRFTYISLSKILGIEPAFLKQGSCVTYRDMDHFSHCGEKIVGDKLKAAFDKMQTAVQ